MTKSIYLAGPITGLSYNEARNGWRKEFAALLADTDIECFSPLRAKDYLESEQVLRGDPGMYPETAMSSPKGILERDYNDVKERDIMVANFLGATKTSIGTCCEFGFAYSLRKPIIMIIEKPDDAGAVGSNRGPNPHWHAFLTEMAGYVVHSLEEAAFLARHLLKPGV